jgi:hypothetical protein
MTVHVRKLNRGMNNQSTTINQSKQAKQQKPVQKKKAHACFFLASVGAAA